MKLEVNYDDLKLQEKLVRLVFQIVVFFAHKTLILQQKGLQTNELNLIISTILPMINDESIIKLEFDSLVFAF